MPASTAPAVTPSTALTAIGQLSIVVKDVPRATAFYRDALGLPMLFEFPGLAFFNCGGVRLMLSGAEKPEFDHPSSILYFTVGDIVATHARLVAAGVAFDDEPHIVHRAGKTNLWMTFFRDPDHNIHALMQDRPADA
jgi:catechol 2,3-dioxygenase-like lactoylglutathione lyase family enzyme